MRTLCVVEKGASASKTHLAIHCSSVNQTHDVALLKKEIIEVVSPNLFDIRDYVTQRSFELWKYLDHNVWSNISVLSKNRSKYNCWSGFHLIPVDNLDLFDLCILIFNIIWWWDRSGVLNFRHWTSYKLYEVYSKMWMDLLHNFKIQWDEFGFELVLPMKLYI